MEAVDKWMNDRALPKKMRYQISKYYAEVCSHLQHVCLQSLGPRSSRLHRQLVDT